MNKEDHDRTIEIAKLTVHEYFDHYLTDVFPQQTAAIISAHDQDAEAHRPVIIPLQRLKQRVDRVLWMVAGGAAVIGAGAGIFLDHAGDILRAVSR
jgi:hypothetical protein